MFSRIATCAVAAAVALFTVSGVVQAAGANKPAKPVKIAKVAKAATHSGKVVSVTEGKEGKEGKLVMSDADGKKEHTHAVLATTKITLNKKSGKLADLKKGDLVTVTLDGSKLMEIAASRDAK